MSTKFVAKFQNETFGTYQQGQDYFQYNSRDLVYLISPLTTQLRTASRKVAIKYVGPLVVFKIVYPHNYLLITLDGKLLQGLFEPTITKTDQGNVTTLAALNKVMTLGLV